ncbi:MAG TPA: ATP-binding protein, partial [bacterium]
NVNEDAPVIFQTRWVMSYLRGPLTRNQIKQLMDAKKMAAPLSAQVSTKPGAVVKEKTHQPGQEKPALPPGIPQYFIPTKSGKPAGTSLRYEPMIFGTAKVYFSAKNIGVAAEKIVSCLAEFSDRPSKIEWDDAQMVPLKDDNLKTATDDNEASYGNLPSEAGAKQNYSDWSKDFNEWLYRNQGLELLKSPSVGIVSLPDESERDFRIRFQQVAREKRDKLVADLRQKYASKISSLEDRIRRAADAVEREKQQSSQQKMQTAISVGTTLLGAFFGRKAVSRSTISKATTVARGASRSMKEAKDVDRAEENLQVLEQQLAELQAELEREIEAVKLSIDPMTESLEKVEVKPKKTDVSVSLVALTWAPYWQDDRGNVQAAW